MPKADKILVGTALFVWLATITAGRLMAYHGIVGVEWAVVRRDVKAMRP